VRLVHGELSVESDTGKDIFIRARVPLKEVAEVDVRKFSKEL
jgi:hypothetical protein